MKRVAKIVIFIVVFAALGGLSAAFYYFHYDVKPAMIRGFIAKAAPPPTSVAVTPARLEHWVPGLTAVGSVRAFQGIDVSSQLSGTIVAIHIGSGQDVTRGTPLYDLDTSVERADLKSNLATLKNAEVGLQRQQMLMTGGNTAKANLDTALATRDQAAAAVDRSKATIAQKTIVAPFDGRLGIRKLDVGQFAGAGTSLITLQQLDPIYVDFPIPEPSLGMLKAGQPVEIKVDAYPEPFRGKIDLIDARIASESRVVMVRALFANPDRRLLPGMFANVTVVAGAPRDVVAVPRTAVTFSLYGDSVYVATPKPAETAGGAGSAQAATPNKPTQAGYAAMRRYVRTGEVKEDKVAILDGVKAGDLVISQGQIKLLNGAAIVIDKTAGLSPPAIRPKE
jgi:membrane fusion protein, multidrug efflux system